MNTTERFQTRPPSLPSASRRIASQLRRAMTLTEVLVAMSLFTMTTLGVLGTLLQSRRSSDFQKKEMIVDTLMQGILEQLKNRTTNELRPSPAPTAPGIPVGQDYMTSMGNLLIYIGAGNPRPTVTAQLDGNDGTGNNVSELILSPNSIYTDPNNINRGAIPSDSNGNGYGDLNGDGSDDVGVNTVFLDLKGTNGKDGSINNTADDLRVNIMIWVKDYTAVSPTAASVRIPSRALIINYTWTYTDGKTSRPMIGSVRAIKTPL